jgi:hypothetical protein
MMNGPTLTCQDERRRLRVRAKEFNGLDYLEVSDDQLVLTVYFLDKAPEGLVKTNVRIEGGRRVRGIEVANLRMCYQEDPERDDCMIVTVDRPGDFSTYTLCLVDLDEDGRPTDRPFPGFDPRYACLEFSFKAGCPSDLDCKPQEICPPEERDEPEINYLAKDYASFRQLILDRLAVVMPDWQERHVPDIGIALVEVLAYVGDHLSYYQDAVATEAYLDTARQRISVRRHARLVDYPMHEGCNARAWVCVATDTDVDLDAQQVSFVTGHNDALPVEGRVITWDDLREVAASQYEVFEPLAADPKKPIQLLQAHNRLRFYTWGDRECCLSKGATAATLQDEWEVPREPEPDSAEPKTYTDATQQTSPDKPSTPPPEEDDTSRKLQLAEGDVLIFEEVVGPRTGNPADADPKHRHAVRLVRVTPGVDPLCNQPVLEIEWAEEDALPFPLCISTTSDAPDCEALEDVSIACGNVILVDHGRRIEGEDLGCVPVARTEEECPEPCYPAETSIVPGRYRPRLAEPLLVFSQPLPADAPAAEMLAQDPRLALPWIQLTSAPDPACEPQTPERPAKDEGQTAEQADQELPEEPPQPVPVTDWFPQRDLLASYSGDPHFVAEMDNERRAYLRFGDGELGRQPEAKTGFTATYRTGHGPAGNVGAEAISHIVTRDRLSGAELEPRNPLPAVGGTAAEPIEQVKLFAPHTFRRRLERAITADDYAQIVMRDFGGKVQRAAATLRWTGSWYEALVAIDPIGSETADPELLDEIAGHLYRYRRIGHDLVVKPACYVPLDIELIVCVLPDYLRGHVKAALIDVFSNRALPVGRLGFFHPDNVTFGEGIYLSDLVAAAQAVPGVEMVVVSKLERLWEGDNGEIASGILPLGPLEVARLDNDPGFPENGLLKLDMGGGR